MNVLLFYLDASLNLGYCIFIYGFIDVTFNFVFVFDYTLSIFYFFLLFIFILLNEQKKFWRVNFTSCSVVKFAWLHWHNYKLRLKLVSNWRFSQRKLTRLKKFKRGTQKAIKFSTELASLKHRENFIAFQ